MLPMPRYALVAMRARFAVDSAADDVVSPDAALAAIRCCCTLLLMMPGATLLIDVANSVRVTMIIAARQRRSSNDV